MRPQRPCWPQICLSYPWASEKATVPATLIIIIIFLRLCKGLTFSPNVRAACFHFPPAEAAFRRLSLVTDDGLSHSDTPAFKTCDNARTSNLPEVKHSPLWSDGRAHKYFFSITSGTLDALHRSERLWPAFILPGGWSDFQIYQIDSNTLLNISLYQTSFPVLAKG